MKTQTQLRLRLQPSNGSVPRSESSFRSALAVTLSSLIATVAHSQSQTTYYEYRLPALWVTTTQPPLGGWGSFDAAWNAFSSYYNSQPLYNPSGYSDRVYNVRAQSDSGLSWGEPMAYVWDYTRYYLGTESYSGTTGTINGQYGLCPPGFSKGSLPTLGSGTAQDPWNSRPYCVIAKTVEHPCSSCQGVGNPILPGNGAKLQIETDIASPRLSFVRTYNSKTGGFSHNYEFDFLPPRTGAIGSALVARSPETGTIVVNPLLAVSDGTAVFTSTRGNRYSFAWNGGTGAASESYNKHRLVATSVNGGSGWLLSDVDAGVIHTVDTNGRLLGKTWLDGGRLSLSYSGAAIADVAPGAGYLTSVTDQFGRSIGLAYTDKGHLARVVDASGQTINFTHDAAVGAKGTSFGRALKPLSVTYQDGNSRSYLWDEATYAVNIADYPNRLTGIVDENGVRFATFRYDGGKALSTEHAEGIDRYAVSDARNAGAGAVSVTLPLGGVNVWQYEIVNGLSLRTSQSHPAGSGYAASTSNVAYDANGNVASSDDFNGKRVCYANDLSRNLAITQVEGLTSADTCGTYTASGAALPAGSRKTSTQWHPDWRLAAKVAEPSRITSYVYNGQPDPFNANAIASCAPAGALLPDGKPIAVLCRQVEQATTDANGSLGFGATLESTVANREQKWTYNQWGQVLSHDGPRTDVADITTYSYYSDTSFTGVGSAAVGHTIGDLQSMTNAAGKVTQYTKYDKHGQLLESVDPNGVVTTSTYDLRQRLLSTSVGGQTTSYTYDPAGQLKRVTKPDASWIGFDYDPAHRQTAVYDNLGNRIEYTLDNAGNRTAENVKDTSGALRRQLARSIDALGRVQQVTGAP